MVEEQHERTRETSELRQQISELRQPKNDRFDEVCNTVEELRQLKNDRVDKIEAYIEEVRSSKNQRFDLLDQKIETEISQREAACRALDKTIQEEYTEVVSYTQKVAKDFQEHRKAAELYQGKCELNHDKLAVEVEKLQSSLRDNSMARDPHKHFRAGNAATVMTRPGGSAGRNVAGNVGGNRSYTPSYYLFPESSPRSPTSLPDLSNTA